MNTQTNSKINSKTTTKTGASRASKNINQTRQADSFSVYLAGDLWTHKDLIGNALLGDYIKKISRGRYHCVLPQDLEVAVNRGVDIRNVDLKYVMTCDMAIFNFDGANLDSGTVVEFMYAKMLDVPCVIFRTDFRSAGEGNQDQEPWNLMATHWPRSKVVKLNGMAEYQGAKTPGALGRTIEKLYTDMATKLIAGLDTVRQEKPLVGDPTRMAALFDWALQCPGSGYSDLFGPNEVQQLIATKTAKGLLSPGSNKA